MKNFMMMALEQARIAKEYGEVPVGSVIVKESYVLARAYNQVEMKNDPTAHAEILAIKDAVRYINNWRLTGCTLYVTLEPCLMCMGAILNARIKRVVYALGDNSKGAVASKIDLMRNPLFKSIEIYGGFCEEESAALFKDFFNKIR
ncbi:MAG: nucleoside deaminase [Eubacteriales bacterium]